jgi:hypothetical protein
VLYIPRLSGQGGVYICPNADNLGQVFEGCSGGYVLSANDPSVSTENLNGSDYWAVSGLTGTGGLGVPLTTSTNFTLTPNQSGVAATQEVVVNYIPAGEFSAGDQVAIDFLDPAFNINNTCTVLTTDADSDATNDGSATVTGNRYLYTFSAATTQAVSNGIEFCINVTSPLPTNSYQVDLSDTLGTYGAELYYVGDSNDVFVTASVIPRLSFAIRNENDTNDLSSGGSANICDLGTLSVSSVEDCSYRLKVFANSSNGYSISIRSDGDLRDGSNTIANVTNGTAVTAGTPSYGISLDGGDATAGTINEAVFFSADDSPIGAGTNNQLLSSSGLNAPAAVDTTNTTLVTHRAAIDVNVPTGNYQHTVTYTVTPSF